jgi:hypothetical protein
VTGDWRLSYHPPVSVIVARSPLRLLAHVLLAIPAVLLAVDMTMSYRFISPPDSFQTVVGSTVNESGVVVDVTSTAFSNQGRAEARRDRLFAVVLITGGVMSIGWAMRDLVRPRLLMRGDQDGLALRVDGPGMPMRVFPWEEIAEVRSGLIDEDGEILPVLSLRLHDPSRVPTEPASAVSDPPWLHVVTDDWLPAAHIVVPVLERASPQATGAADPA